MESERESHLPKVNQLLKNRTKIQIPDSTINYGVPLAFQTCPKWGPRPTNWPLHQSHFLATGVGSETLLTLILKVEGGRRMKAKILPCWYTLCLGRVDIILPTNIHSALSQHPRSLKLFFGWGCQTNKSSQSKMSSAIPSMPHSPPVPWVLSRGNRMRANKQGNSLEAIYGLVKSIHLCELPGFFMPRLPLLHLLPSANSWFPHFCQEE